MPQTALVLADYPWWDLAPGRGVLELDEPEVDLELEIIGGWWASVTIPS